MYNQNESDGNQKCHIFPNLFQYFGKEELLLLLGHLITDCEFSVAEFPQILCVPADWPTLFNSVYVLNNIKAFLLSGPYLFDARHDVNDANHTHEVPNVVISLFEQEHAHNSEHYQSAWVTLTVWRKIMCDSVNHQSAMIGSLKQHHWHFFSLYSILRHAGSPLHLVYTHQIEVIVMGS